MRREGKEKRGSGGEGKIVRKLGLRIWRRVVRKNGAGKGGKKERNLSSILILDLGDRSSWLSSSELVLNMFNILLTLLYFYHK